jgi:YidC/Oxa1 family membrane protein insertase
MFIQLPIFIGLYNAITRTLGVTPFNLLDLGKHVYGFIPNLSSLVPINSNFLGMDLGQPDKFFIIPILVVATTYLSNKLMTPPATDAQTKQTNQMMQMMMPLMFGFFMLSAPAGLGIYWLVSNLIQVAQYYIMKPRLEATRAQYGLPSLSKPNSSGSASKAVIEAERPAPPKSRARGSNFRFNKPEEKKDK